MHPCSLPSYLAAPYGADVDAPEEVWGRIETFDEVPSGTSHDIAGLDLLPSSDTDLVFLDGSLWIMFRGNESREIARYSPSVPQTGWNISFEAFAPREGSAYYGVGKVPGRFSLIATIEDGEGGILAGIDLRISTVDQEGIYLNQGDGAWTKMVGDIEPALSRDTSTIGRSPDRYTICLCVRWSVLEHDRPPGPTGNVVDGTDRSDGIRDSCPSHQRCHRHYPATHQHMATMGTTVVGWWTTWGQDQLGRLTRAYPPSSRP